MQLLITPLHVPAMAQVLAVAVAWLAWRWGWLLLAADSPEAAIVARGTGVMKLNCLTV